MPDYSQGKIYKIVVKNDPSAKCYIGSTVKKLNDRWYNHISDAYNQKVVNKCSSKQLFDQYGVNNCEIQLIENFPCTTKEDLLTRETYWIRQISLDKLVNHYKPYQTKEERKEYKKSWFEQHREQYLKKWAQKITCNCGSVHRINDKARHLKTTKHLDYIASLSIPKPKLRLKIKETTD